MVHTIILSVKVHTFRSFLNGGNMGKSVSMTFTRWFWSFVLSSIFFFSSRLSPLSGSLRGLLSTHDFLLLVRSNHVTLSSLPVWLLKVVFYGRRQFGLLLLPHSTYSEEDKTKRTAPDSSKDKKRWRTWSFPESKVRFRPKTLDLRP